MSRPIGTPAELERRRRRAVELVHQGEAPSTVARILGVNRNSLYRWRKAAEGGLGRLAAQPHPGPAPRLNAAQLGELDALLRQGARAQGWPDARWTVKRVAELIRRHFHVSFHPEQVRKLLRYRLHWSGQRPQTPAQERNEEEIERWLRDFRRIRRRARRRKAHLIFLDESGFLLRPLVRRTLAPRGETPVLPCWDRHDRISAISCITLSPVRDQPGLYFELLPVDANVTAVEVVAFLRQLKRHLPGPWVLLWDRNKIHSRALAVRAWLVKHPEVVIEDFPAYAPELNPDEMVWGYTKYHQLANFAPADAWELRLIAELVDLQSKPALLRAFVKHAGLPLRLRSPPH
jgi:transposase